MCSVDGGLFVWHADVFAGTLGTEVTAYTEEGRSFSL
jgi:hypothetical protein